MQPTIIFRTIIPTKLFPTPTDKTIGYSSVSDLGIWRFIPPNRRSEVVEYRHSNLDSILAQFGAGIVWGWHKPNGSADRNDSFSTGDLSLSFRPFSFLGLSAGTRNLGSDHPEVPIEYYSGLGLRTFSGALSIGADWTIRDAQNIYEGNLTLQPLSGIELRIFGNSSGSWGGGVHFTGSLELLEVAIQKNYYAIMFKVPTRRPKRAKNKLVSFFFNPPIRTNQPIDCSRSLEHHTLICYIKSTRPPLHRMCTLLFYA